MKKSWTKDEIQFLHNNHTNMTSNQLAKELNRSRDSVRCKLYSEGLKKDRNYWTKEEIDILTENYKVFTNDEIAKMLNRSIHSIKRKVVELQLASSNWTKEEEEYLIGYYGIRPINALMKRLNKSKYQIRRKMKLLEGTSNVNIVSTGFCTKDICEILGTGMTTVYNWVKGNKIPNIRISKGIIVYPEEAFWKWLKNNLDKPVYHKIDDSILNILPEWYEEEIRKNKRENIKNKYNKQYKWTKYEITTLLNMKSKDYTFKQIGNELSRSHRSVSSKYYDLIKERSKKGV